MIIYLKTKEAFCNDIQTNNIGCIISDLIEEKTGKKVTSNEARSFENSLSHMKEVLDDKEIPDNCGISIEYHLPQTSRRVDLIITGKNGEKENAIIVELKQWKQASVTNKDGIVKTRFEHGESETSHPSYQAWSYAAFLKSFNATVDEGSINIYPCAYLHNYAPDDCITDPFYQSYINKAPLFLQPDMQKFREFIKKHIKQGDSGDIITKLDNGKIRPAKHLADSLQKMMDGNEEFIMLDDQKMVYETALDLAIHSHAKNKNVLIVEGGPGTGKSVVAINLLVELIKKEKITKYVTKTSAPRDVYKEKLKGQWKTSTLKSLFPGSGSFSTVPQNEIDTLLVDEAHRLIEKNWKDKNSYNQIEEILKAAVNCVFFIDEKQSVSFSDYGKVHLIEEFARDLNIEVHKLSLKSQFRCNGSDGYLDWLDHILQIRENKDFNLNEFNHTYDFQVFDNASDMRQMIFDKNEINNKARIVAGYCWDWASKENLEVLDFKEDEFGFNMQWNLDSYGGKWIIEPKSVSEIGCIHTAQGLEVDYIGVIIGNDLVARNGKILVNPAARAVGDRTLNNWREKKNEPEDWKPRIKTIIKNTYRTLMTRGIKGCYIYSTDPETRDYFKEHISPKKSLHASST